MIEICTLASGSSGNALAVSCGGTRLLVDAGISCRRIAQGLRTLGTGLDGLDAVLITHTHTDHIAGLQALLRRTDCPVSATARTARGLEYRLTDLAGRLRPIECGRPFAIGGAEVTAFAASHDAPGCCGYRFDCGGAAAGILTDTGYVTEEAAEILPGVGLAVLEANHDVETLLSGPYPYSLKRRILGEEGHLSNEDAAAFAVTLAGRGAEELVLAHLSRENNTPAMALAAAEAALNAAGLSPGLSAAPRDRPGQVRRVGKCRG